jgi:hypothetical protein
VAKRVFFSFHYQDVIDFRANVVRQHWLTKPDRDAAGFFDASIWGNAKLSGDTGIKRVINAGLENTTVTTILIGTATYARRWVRYEIMKSFRRANAIFAVHINSIKGRDQFTKAKGLNPLQYLGVRYSESGLMATLLQYLDGEWKEYTDIDGVASYQTGGVAMQYRNRAFKLAEFYREYDWVADDGYNNFTTWVG